MKPAVLLAVGMCLGFAIAWMVKPQNVIGTIASAAQRTRAESQFRSKGTASAITDQAAADVFQRMQQAQGDQMQLDKLFAEIPAGEIESLLARFQVRAGFDGLEYYDRYALRRLLMSWYLKSPAEAQAWLQGVGKDTERSNLLGGIVEDLAVKDLDAAMDLLRKQERGSLGSHVFSSGLFQAAVNAGPDRLLELCQLGLYCGPSRGSATEIVGYPKGFDFRRLLDGLAEMKAGAGDDAKFTALPQDLVGEWTKQDPKTVWEWLKQDKCVDECGKLQFFDNYARLAKPAEVAALLAEDFKPEAPVKDRYENILSVLDQYPSPEMLNEILKATPGDRAAHLQALLDQHAGFSMDPAKIDPPSKLILESMEPGERLDGLRRIYSGIDDSPFDYKDDARKGITPLLLRMGHSMEEINSLFPPDRKE